MPRAPRNTRSLKLEARDLATFLLVWERVMGDFPPEERRRLVRRALASLDSTPDAKRSEDVAREARKILAGMLRK